MSNRTKISDWRVGEPVVFVSSHGGTRDLKVLKIGRKYIEVGTDDSHRSVYKFHYENGWLRFEGGYSHQLYTPEEYKLMNEYESTLRALNVAIGEGLRSSSRHTERNIKLLKVALRAIRTIKKPESDDVRDERYYADEEDGDFYVFDSHENPHKAVSSWSSMEDAKDDADRRNDIGE